MSRAISRTRSWSREIIRGVKPLFTMSRSRVCRGGSICSIIIRCWASDSSVPSCRVIPHSLENTGCCWLIVWRSS